MGFQILDTCRCGGLDVRRLYNRGHGFSDFGCVWMWRKRGQFVISFSCGRYKCMLLKSTKNVLILWKRNLCFRDFHSITDNGAVVTHFFC